MKDREKETERESVYLEQEATREQMKASKANKKLREEDVWGGEGRRHNFAVGQKKLG